MFHNFLGDNVSSDQNAHILKKAKNNHKVNRAAIAILNYLRDHPDAKDDAQGIARWWVGQEREIVEEALRLLHEKGVIEKRQDFYHLAAHAPASGELSVVEKTLHRLKRKR